MKARRIRRRAHLDRLLERTEPLEPRTSALDSKLLARSGRGRRVYVAEDERGRLAGLVVVYRHCVDRWGAYVVLLDVAAAVVLAPVLDRSPARDVAGSEGDVTPLVPLLRRAGRVDHLYWIFGEPPFPALEAEHREPDPRTRLATLADLDALTRLYSTYELLPIPTRFQLRRFLRRVIVADLPIAVIEIDGRVVGADRIADRTRRFLRWSDLTVLPDYRRRGFATALNARLWRVVLDAELGVVTERVPTSQVPRGRGIEGMSPDPGFLTSSAHEWLAVRLRTPVWFRGHGKLRHVAYRLGGRLDRGSKTAGSD